MAQQIILALIGGVLPALVWLVIWLREDNKNPEPRRLILRSFLLGMAAVILVLPLQNGVEVIFTGSVTFVTLLLWAALEEVLKFFAGYFGGLSSREDNEPVDPMIYMITAALGFVALENTLFILGPLLGGDLGQSIVTGNLRFVGASLLHIAASGVIGVFLSFSFYKSKWVRIWAGLNGLAVAIIFHDAFNFAIIKYGDTGTYYAFLAVWIVIIALLLVFERVKALRAPNTGL